MPQVKPIRLSPAQVRLLRRLRDERDPDLRVYFHQSQPDKIWFAAWISSPVRRNPTRTVQMLLQHRFVKLGRRERHQAMCHVKFSKVSLLPKAHNQLRRLEREEA